MAALEQLDKIAGLGVGVTAAVLSGGTSGIGECTVATAGLIGHVLGKKSYGPECKRVRKRLEKQLIDDFDQFLKAENCTDDQRAYLDQSIDAMNRYFADCKDSNIDFAKIAKAEGDFITSATELVMAQIRSVNSETRQLFDPKQSHETHYKFAYLVIETCFNEVLTERGYYEKLEASMMVEALQSLGAIERGIDKLDQKYDRDIVLERAKSDKLKDRLIDEAIEKAEMKGELALRTMQNEINKLLARTYDEEFTLKNIREELKMISEWKND